MSLEKRAGRFDLRLMDGMRISLRLNEQINLYFTFLFGSKFMEFKTKNKRYCCDVNGCDNYAHAEMYRAGKGAWMYVCKKHYKLKFGKNGRIRRNDIGFYILGSKDKVAKKEKV